MIRIILKIGFIFLFSLNAYNQVKLKTDYENELSIYEVEKNDTNINEIYKLLNLNKNYILIKISNREYLTINKKSICYKVENNKVIDSIILNKEVSDSTFIYLNSLLKINPSHLLNEENEKGLRIIVQDGNEYKIDIFKNNKELNLYTYAPEIYIEKKIPYFEEKIKFTRAVNYFKNLFYLSESSDKKEILTINLKDSLYVKNCSHYNFGKYVAAEYETLNQIPKVSSIIKKYLSNRVHPYYLNKMYFKKAQVIDSIPFKKEFPKAEMKTRFHYFLCFAFSDSNKGIGEYTSNLEIDEHGNIIKDIEFPKRTASNSYLASLQKIKKELIRKGFYRYNSTKIDLIYETNKDLLIWHFINEEVKENGELFQHIMSYNAHTGNYLSIETIKLYRVQ